MYKSLFVTLFASAFAVSLDANSIWNITYTPGLTKELACEDATGFNDHRSCVRAFHKAKAKYERGN